MGSRPRRGAIAWLLAALALSAAALADTRESRDPYLGQLAGQRDMLVAADGNSATLLLESQEKDGSWSTFARYRMTRIPQSPAAPPGGASRGP